MQKITILLLMVLGSLNLTAQTQIFNSNFEHWTTALNGTDSLIGWSSSNNVVIYPVKSLYKEEESFEGQYAGNLVTAPFGFVGYTTIGILVNGIAKFSYGGGGGGANVEYVSDGGTPISFKPTELRGHYKFLTLNPPDRGLATVLLTKYNTSLNKRDTVGIAYHQFTEAENYTEFSIPISYNKPGVTPDSITTIFYSSDLTIVDPFNTFSNLYLDGLYLFPVIVSTEEPKENDFSFYPNPCSDVIKIKLINDKANKIDIYNSFGQRVRSISTLSGNKELVVDTRDLSAGVYYLSNNNLVTKKLVVIK